MPPLISFRNLTKSYSTRVLFRDLSLGMNDDERIGLIGPNGAGKSTLIRILAGLETMDAGEVSSRRGIRTVLVAQEDALPADRTILELLTAAMEGLPLEPYEQEARLTRVLLDARFPNPDLTVSALSGGMKKRLALSIGLIQEPDLLLLDEPTNHLDLESVIWLENVIREASFAVIVITHDRYFLQNVANRIVELNGAYPGGYLSVAGAYSDYLTRKEELLASQAHQERALAGRVDREIEWLRRGPQARTTKAKARIDQAHEMIAELADLSARNALGKTATVDFTASGRKTRELLVARGVAKSYQERRLYSNVDLLLTPGIKLGLVGPNGSGKTTLLKILAGDIEPDSGTVWRAPQLRIVRFSQDRSALKRDLSLRDALSPNGDNVLYKGSSMHVAGWARRFLFRPEQLDMPVGALSGGEQARVLIANLMLDPADLLVLDEPTNDLDIPTLEVLQESLEEFTGALLLVTHDRYLLDQVATLILALDGDGHTGYYADYSQWERDYAARSAAVPVKPVSAPAPRPVQTGLNTQERRELGQMEARIEAAESAHAALEEKMHSPEVASDPARLQETWAAVEGSKVEVARLYERWDELERKRAGSS